MLAASPGVVRIPALATGSLAVLLMLSPVTYYLVEAPMQRVGRGSPGGRARASRLTAWRPPAPTAATEGFPAGPL